MNKLMMLCGVGASVLAATTAVGSGRNGVGNVQSTIAGLVAQSGGAFDHNRNDYDLLLTALQTANLTSALDDPTSDLTVFAPNDWAFILLARDLGYPYYDEQGAWNFLVAALTAIGGGDPVPTLTAVLTYHVSPESLTTADIAQKRRDGETIATLQGATITPLRGGRLEDQEPDVADPVLKGPFNIVASNGIIQPISRVLLPVNLP